MWKEPRECEEWPSDPKGQFEETDKNTRPEDERYEGKKAKSLYFLSSKCYGEYNCEGKFFLIPSGSGTDQNKYHNVGLSYWRDFILGI